MKTRALLPYTRVCVYDHDYDAKRHGESRDRYFATPEEAAAWLARVGARVHNTYRLDRVNGTWRSDWQLAE